MRFLGFIGVLGTLGMLAGCATDIEQMRIAEATGGNAFTQALTEQYRQITAFEADEMYDWPDAGYFARKGLAAAGGEVVLPEEPGNWDISEDHLQELTDARARLMAALDGGGREYNPEAAARAQGRFDCWIEQQEENHQPDHIAACRDEFLAAMAALETTVTIDPVGAYVILFDFDSAELNDAGQAVVNQILADIPSRRGSVSATGHADRSGSEDYNLSLSLRRADTIREALIAGGVAADAITTAGRGESENAIPTADGVKEKWNRRVEVILQ